jgi:hypothetical protein
MLQIARELELTEITVRSWLKRFNNEGFDGLADLSRSGRPATYSAEQVAEVIAAANIFGGYAKCVNDVFSGCATYNLSLGIALAAPAVKSLPSRPRSGRSPLTAASLRLDVS